MGRSSTRFNSGEGTEEGGRGELDKKRERIGVHPGAISCPRGSLFSMQTPVPSASRESLGIWEGGRSRKKVGVKRTCGEIADRRGASPRLFRKSPFEKKFQETAGGRTRSSAGPQDRTVSRTEKHQRRGRGGGLGGGGDEKRRGVTELPHLLSSEEVV